jgi:hypothetical protein
MSIEAMKQALKFCEEIGDLRGPYPFVNETSIVSDSRKVLTALRQAIAEAEMVEKGTKAWADTPNDWVDELRGGVEKQEFECPRCGHCCPEREWVGLTDKQIDDIMRPLTQNQPYSWRLFARAIEAKLKERNI